MSVNKPSYFLAHLETGQRYPIRGPVIIGRLSGDIVFSRDTKLSNQHCEVSPSELGLAVRDLHSANGTYIDGKLMAPDRTFLLQEDGELKVGDQEFTLKVVTLTRNLRKRRKKKRAKVGESYSQVFLMLIAAVAFFAWHNRASFDRVSQMQLSQRQLSEIFEGYQELETSLERQTAAPQEIGRRMQGQVLGKLATISRRWGEFQPADDDRQLFAGHLHFASALAGHAKNEILYITTAETKYVDEIDQWTDQLEQAVTEIHASPGGSTFPSLVQSPLQLVEREMRQSLRDYRKLGASVKANEITEKDMGQRIRENLMPKMNSVYAKMGAIAPQNDFERRKVVLEQKLMTAILGQVKSMSIVAESHDPKYVAELNHWTSEIEKLNKELKQQMGLGRTPAGHEGPQGP